MDLLSQRYASPCFFLDGMIRTGRLDEFVEDFVQTDAKDRDEKATWEYYLHKIFDGKSFNDFKEEIENDRKNREMPERILETTVQYSANILNTFNPEKKGGE